MIESIFDFFLLHIIQIEFVEFIDRLNFINQLNFINRFEVIDIQTDDTLILADDEFVTLKQNELVHAHLTFKQRKKLILTISIK
jgi:hypothetical protein